MQLPLPGTRGCFLSSVSVSGTPGGGPDSFPHKLSAGALQDTLVSD